MRMRQKVFLELKDLIRLIFECAEGGSNANKPPRADRRPNPHPYPKYLYFLGKGRGQAQFVLCLFLAERSQDFKFCGQVRKRAEHL